MSYFLYPPAVILAGGPSRRLGRGDRDLALIRSTYAELQAAHSFDFVSRMRLHLAHFHNLILGGGGDTVLVELWQKLLARTAYSRIQILNQSGYRAEAVTGVDKIIVAIARAVSIVFA